MKCLKKYIMNISIVFHDSLHNETIVKYAFHQIVWKNISQCILAFTQKN